MARFRLPWACFALLVTCADPSQTTPFEPPDAPPPPPPPPASVAGFFVADDGSAAGDGSAADPWDLATALNHPPTVAPGDTIWVCGGTYTGVFRSRLLGTAAAPVVVRQQPGERATIDGGLVIEDGGYAWFWGLEVTNDGEADQPAVTVRSPGIKLINVIVHDAGGTGVGLWLQAVGAELNGSLIYNNGLVDGHGAYVQNDPGARKLLKDNVWFANGPNGDFEFQLFGTQAEVSEITVDGNIAVQTGYINAGLVMRTDDQLVMRDIRFTNNMIYGDRQTGTVQYGPNGTAGGESWTFEGNYIVGSVYTSHWDAVTYRHNTLIIGQQRLFIPQADGFPAYTWHDNTYYGETDVARFRVWHDDAEDTLRSWSEWVRDTGYDWGSTFVATPGGKPTENAVFVRPNDYEPGRANIAVFNWQKLASVPVDVSSAGLVPGQAYEVRHVFDWWGAPVAQGVYTGAPIVLSMADVDPPAPGGTAAKRLPSPGDEFAAFVLLPIRD